VVDRFGEEGPARRPWVRDDRTVAHAPAVEPVLHPPAEPGGHRHRADRPDLEHDAAQCLVDVGEQAVFGAVSTAAGRRIGVGVRILAWTGRGIAARLGIGAGRTHDEPRPRRWWISYRWDRPLISTVALLTSADNSHTPGTRAGVASAAMAPVSPTVARWELVLRLRELREQRGFDSAGFAKLVGFTPANWSHVEKGRRVLTTNTIGPV